MLFKPNQTNQIKTFKIDQKVYNKQFDSVLSKHFNNLNDATAYNLNNTELNDLLNLVTFITLTIDK
jgi:hypothetical protein